MKAHKINGLWCLSNENGEFLCSLIGEPQPKDRDEALRRLLERYKKNA